MWDQVLWGSVAVSVWVLYQTPPAKILRSRLQCFPGNWLGENDSRILVNWVFWTFIPMGILLSHGSLARMRIKPPLIRADVLAVWIALFCIEYLLVVAEFYIRNRVKGDLESARRVVAWTNDLRWVDGIVGGLKQNVPEETFFRGYLLSEIHPLSPLLGYGFSALSFGLIHRYWDRWKILTTAIGGLIYAWLFIYTDSIIPPITVHIAVNLLIIPPAGHWSRRLLETYDQSSNLDG